MKRSVIVWGGSLAPLTLEEGRDHLGGTMIANDQELGATLERIRRLQAQVTHLRKLETNPVNYRLSVSGFLAEIDRMQLEVREYLSLHPAERAGNT